MRTVSQRQSLPRETEQNRALRRPEETQQFVFDLTNYINVPQSAMTLPTRDIKSFSFSALTAAIDQIEKPEHIYIYTATLGGSAETRDALDAQHRLLKNAPI